MGEVAKVPGWILSFLILLLSLPARAYGQTQYSAAKKVSVGIIYEALMATNTLIWLRARGLRICKSAL